MPLLALRRAVRRAPVLVPLALSSSVAAAPRAAQTGPFVDLVPVGRDVYAAVRREPLGLAQNGNSLVVVGDDAVLVVDAQFTREATLETIAALRGVTRKPVRWVVNTHWHDDHFAGNQVYRDSFPGVEFVIHANTREDLQTVARANRRGELAGGPAAMDRYERLLGMGLGVDSTPATDAERAVIRTALRIYRRYLAEAPQFRETMEGPTVQERHTVRLGRRAVEVRWYGRGATRGDLVVHVPDAGVVAVGDLVVLPVPFAFGAHPAAWIAALDSVRALRPRAIVPGHGPVLRDLAPLDRTRRMLTAVRSAARDALGRGLAPESIPRAVAADAAIEALRREVAGDDKWMNWLWRQYFLHPAVARSLLEARQERPAP